jgi:hypothetical protein
VRRIPAQFAKADEIISDAIFPLIGVGRPERPVEAVHPPQEWQAKRSAAALTKFLVDIPLFAAKSSKGRVEAKPGVAPARK